MGKIIIMPAISKKPPSATVPMEPVLMKSSNTDMNGHRANNSAPMKTTPQDFLTHVIDGHVIQESSQPFPLNDDLKGELVFLISSSCYGQVDAWGDKSWSDVNGHRLAASICV
jgi:hypothetical protein